MNIIIVRGQNQLSRFPFTNTHKRKIKKIVPKAKIFLEDESDQKLDSLINIADILIASRLISIDLNKAKNLKWIHVTSAGVNNLPENLKNSDILITNSSGVHPIPISEHVFAFILMLARGIHVSFRNQILEKRWVRDYESFNADEVTSKKITIVGLGRIGTRVAELAKAFGMKVFGVVRNPNRQEAVDKLVGMDNLDQVLKISDFVVDCLPATFETKHIFDLKRFKKFKKGAYFINIGRGDTVVEKDLIFALKNNIIAGAGLDVFETEPLPETSPLWRLRNVIITPHTSGSTPYYLDRLIDIFCENLKAFVMGREMPNLVDKKLGY